MSSDSQTPVLHNTNNVCSIKARSLIIAKKCRQVSNEEGQRATPNKVSQLNAQRVSRTNPTSSPTKTAPFHLRLISFIHSSPAGNLPTSTLIWHINILASTRLEEEKKTISIYRSLLERYCTYLHSLDAQTARWMTSRLAINPRLFDMVHILCQVGKVHRYLIYR